MKWFIYQRGAIPPYRLEIAYKGIFLHFKKFSGTFVETIYYNQGPKLWWAWNEKQIRNYGQSVLKKIGRKTGLRHHVDLFKKLDQRAIKASEKIRKTSLKSLSNNKLIEIFGYLDKQCLPARVMDIDIDSMDIVMEDHIIHLLIKELKNKIDNQEIVELYKILAHTPFLSYASRMEQSIKFLALTKEPKQKQIEKIYQQYWWTSLGWETIIPYTKGFFNSAVKKYQRQPGLRKNLAKLEGRIKLVKRQRLSLVKKYSLSPKIKHWLNVIDQYNYLHDERKETQVKTMFAYHLLLIEAARRFGLNKNDLEWCWHDEVKNLFLGQKVDQKKIARRKIALAILATRNKLSSWSGQKAKGFYNQELLTKASTAREFKGMGVTSGLVRAKVKVCNGAVMANKKVKKGDILVIPNTLPDCLPAMKKASAIITNEGGITCHAAIIAREFHIPCVVGTKIATEVLHDGDLVEVNANQGIVKLIKS